MSHFSSKYVGSFCLVNQKLLFICLKNATYSMLNIPIFLAEVPFEVPLNSELASYFV